MYWTCAIALFLIKNVTMEKITPSSFKKFPEFVGKIYRRF